MVKLKNIIKEIRAGHQFGDTFHYDFKVNENILALCCDLDELEISVDIEYSGNYHEIDIEGHKVAWLIINNDRQVKYDFLHPEQKKIIDSIVELELHNNERKITKKIMGEIMNGRI